MTFSKTDIENLKALDPLAQKKLLKCYAEKLYNVVYYHLQNREQAEEITQDAFIKIIDKIKNFEERSSFDTWVYRIAVNLSLDKIRYNKRAKRKVEKTPLHQLINPLDDKQLNPEAKLQSDENMQILLEAIESLPDRQKSALVLSKLEGKKQSEVAEILDLSTKAVESLISRAKKALKEKIALKLKELKI